MPKDNSKFKDFKYYLYQHTRLDSGQVFYIGIGTKSNYDFKNNYFTRAFNKSKRSIFWKNIENKSGRQVEILFGAHTYEEVKAREIFLISTIGRKDLNLGNLANLTNGGEGTAGIILTKERKIKIGNGLKNSKKRNKNVCAKKVYQYDTQGNFVKEWESCIAASMSFRKTSKTTISAAVKLKSHFSKNYYWFLEYKGLSIIPPLYHKKVKGGIEMLDKDTLKVLKSFASIKEAYTFLNVKNESGFLRKCCKITSRNAYGYKWRYKCPE